MTIIKPKELSAIQIYKRKQSESFRRSLTTYFFETEKEEVTEEDTICIPKDFLLEICLMEKLPPCFFLFNNNIEIDPTLIYNEHQTDILIREA